MRKLHKNLCILEAADKPTLDEMVLAIQKAGLLVQKISDQFAAVDPSRIDDVLRILRDLGHLAKVVN